MSVMTSPSLQVGTNFQSMRTLQQEHMPVIACQAALQLARLAGLRVEQGGRATLAPGLPGSKGHQTLYVLPIRCRHGCTHKRVLNGSLAEASVGVIR